MLLRLTFTALATSMALLVLLSPSSAVACSFGCAHYGYEIRPSARVATTGPIYARVLTDDGCDDDATGLELEVRDAMGTLVEGSTERGVWRGAEPLVDGATYTVEMLGRASVLTSTTVTAVALDEPRAAPTVTISAREISRACAGSCCPATGVRGQYDTKSRSESGDTFFDGCTLAADCSRPCTSFCGTTRLAVMPQVELRWTRTGTLHDAYTFYEVYKGDPNGRPDAELAPWERFATVGSVDPAGASSGFGVSFAVFLPGEPLCLTLVPVSALEDAPGAPITACVDEADVVRLEARVPDLSAMQSTCDELTITSEFDLTTTTSFFGEPSLIGAWCGEVVAEPFEAPPEGDAVDDAGCTLTTGPVRLPGPLGWLACLMGVGVALVPRRRVR